MLLCVDENGNKWFDCRVHFYMEQGNSTVTKRLLLESTDNFCDLADSSGSTLLHYAAKYNNVQILEYLISSGSNINAKNNGGFTPIMLAVQLGHRMTIQKLLEAKASISIQNNLGENALQLVFRLLAGLNVHHKHFKILRLFMRRVKDDCANDSELMAKRLIEAKCPLYFAIYLQNASVTRTMLKSGYSVTDHEPELKFTALHVAVSLEHLANVKLLVENGVGPKCCDCNGHQPITWYSLDTKETPQKLEILDILLRHSDPHSVYTHLKAFHTLRYVSREAMRIFIRYIDLRTPLLQYFVGTDKYTCLHQLVCNETPDIMYEIPDDKFSFDTLGYSEVRLLSFAVESGNVSTVEFLLKKGVQVNCLDFLGRTALFEAFEEKAKNVKTCLKIIHVLLEHGANVQIIAKRELTLFDCASREKNFALIRPILAKLALLESLEKPINKLMYKKISAHPMFNNYFKLCRLYLERMKRITVHKSVTLYKLLTECDEKVMSYAGNCQFPNRFNYLMRPKRRSNMYYYFVLRRRTNKLINPAQLKREAGLFLREIIQAYSHYLIVNINTVTDNILRYLSVDDWKNLREAL